MQGEWLIALDGLEVPPYNEVEAVEIRQKRLRILGDDEIEAIYGRPRFTPEERLQYFALSQSEKDLLQEFRSVHSQAYFILQLGYFKAKRLFFTFELSGDRRGYPVYLGALLSACAD